MLFPLNNYNDVIRAVNEFDKVKPALQKHRWMVIESTLAKLDKTVEVEVDNPINKFDTRRVICKESKNNNNIFFCYYFSFYENNNNGDYMFYYINIFFYLL